MGKSKLGKRYCLIGAVAVAMSFFSVLPSIAQSDEIAELNKKINELTQVDPDNPDIAQALIKLTVLYRQGSRYGEAEPLAARALAIYEKVRGPDHPDVAEAQYNLALLRGDQGRYAEAEPLLKKSLEIRERYLGSENLAVADSLIGLARLYREVGRYAESESLYNRSLTIQQKILGANNLAVALSLNNLGALQRAMGHYVEAEENLRGALAIREKVLGPNDGLVAATLALLGRLYEELTDYHNAEQLYERSLQIRDKNDPNSFDVTFSLDYLGSLYVNRHRFREAAPLLERAAKIREKLLGLDHSLVAKSLNSLGQLYANQGRYVDAERQYNRSLAIRKKSLGSIHPDVAESLNNLALLNVKRGRYADAETLFKQALEIYEKSLGPDHPQVAELLKNLTEFFYDRNRVADALPIVRKVIARKYATKAVEFNKPVSFAVLYKSMQRKLTSPVEAFKDSYEVVQQVASSAAAKAISQLAARFKAGSDGLAERVRRDQALAQESAELKIALINAYSKPPDKRSVNTDELFKKLEANKEDREKLLEEFKLCFPDYLALSKPQSLSFDETRALLADDEAIIVFDFDAKSYAWVITKTATDWLELKVRAAELESWVKTLRATMIVDVDRLGIRRPRAFKPAVAHQVYQATFGAIADKFTGKKRLSVVTNGALTRLPPQLLVNKNPAGKKLKDVDWLVKSYAITILPSVVSMKVLRDGFETTAAVAPNPNCPQGLRRGRIENSKAMIAFANPQFHKIDREWEEQRLRLADGIPQSEPPRLPSAESKKINIAELAETLDRLPGTGKEVLAIAGVLDTNKNDIFLEFKATETAVKEAALEQYRIVYFATHGLLSEYISSFAKAKAEVEPALALTIPSILTERDDGLLFASEVAQLKLNADWVVLSACNTAAENKPGAEAFSGLARAFFYAGARSLIVSHWNVDDNATVQLMTATFKVHHDMPNLSHAEVLQNAMQQMLKDAKSDVEAHPRFWAPFVVVGEPKKISVPQFGTLKN